MPTNSSYINPVLRAADDEVQAISASAGVVLMPANPEPKIYSAYEPGYHNMDLGATVVRLDKAAQWKDLSCVIISPVSSKQGIPPRVVMSWMNLIKPPNNRSTHMMPTDMEVGAAYSSAIDLILMNPDLSKWKYILCLEHDNAPPQDGLVRLLQQMEAHPEFAAIGGLYFTKGELGCAQIWGAPREPTNFRPQLPDPFGGLVECCGTGMGFTVFRLATFLDKRLRKPWFKTVNGSEGQGVGTQDLYFWGDARKHGYRCAVDCSIRVGHYDSANDFMW